MNIDTENWERLQQLFHLAEQTTEEDRERVLTQEGADDILRRQVLAILAGAAIEAPTAGKVGGELEGRIGPYRMVRHIGSGGLGSVYLVERNVGGAIQRSALKVMALHAAGGAFLERFYREEQILASLDHPNITHMFDAGLSENGQPYLVMEYVDGVHLDAYCDEHRLRIDERIGLLLKVCDAVAYAHRNLVVHLDLKPSNILVTEDGAVKLLDFGTSKVLASDGSLTSTILATPGYASPEQLRNEGVTTACDVYALGAVLFKLLAGRRPGERNSVAVMIERAMREQEPERVSDVVTEEAAERLGTTAIQLRHLLERDLATITAKCMRVRPQDRYLSVDALADDLRRYLAGRPVLAAAQTVGYRIRKFVRRNRKAVVAAVAVTVVLLSSLGYANLRREEALREARRAVKMQAFMAQLFKLANTHYMGKPAATVPELLQLGSILLPQMIQDPADRRAGEISLAESMCHDADYKDAEELLGQVIPEARSAGDIPAEAEAAGYAALTAFKLGKLPEYAKLSARALELADQPGVPPDVRVWIKSSYTQNRYDLGRATAADVEIERGAVREARSPKVLPETLGYAVLDLAYIQTVNGTLADSEKLAEEGVAIFGAEPYAVCERAGAEQVLGFLRREKQDPQGSLEAYREAYRGMVACRGEDSGDALIEGGFLGMALLSAGHPQEAIAMDLNVIAKMEKTIGPNSLALRPPLSGLARAYLALKQYPESAAASERLFRIMDGKVNAGTGQMGVVQLTWAEALAGEGKTAEALVHARLADRAYADEGSKLPATAASAQRAHKLVEQLQTAANPSQK